MWSGVKVMTSDLPLRSCGALLIARHLSRGRAIIRGRAIGVTVGVRVMVGYL